MEFVEVAGEQLRSQPGAHCCAKNAKPQTQAIDAQVKLNPSMAMGQSAELIGNNTSPVLAHRQTVGFLETGLRRPTEAPTR